MYQGTSPRRQRGISKEEAARLAQKLSCPTAQQLRDSHWHARGLEVNNSSAPFAPNHRKVVHGVQQRRYSARAKEALSPLEMKRELQASRVRIGGDSPTKKSTGARTATEIEWQNLKKREAMEQLRVPTAQEVKARATADHVVIRDDALGGKGTGMDAAVGRPNPAAHRDGSTRRSPGAADGAHSSKALACSPRSMSYNEVKAKMTQDHLGFRGGVEPSPDRLARRAPATGDARLLGERMPVATREYNRARHRATHWQVGGEGTASGASGAASASSSSSLHGQAPHHRIHGRVQEERRRLYEQSVSRQVLAGNRSPPRAQAGSQVFPAYTFSQSRGAAEGPQGAAARATPAIRGPKDVYGAALSFGDGQNGGRGQGQGRGSRTATVAGGTGRPRDSDARTTYATSAGSSAAAGTLLPPRARPDYARRAHNYRHQVVLG